MARKLALVLFLVLPSFALAASTMIVRGGSDTGGGDVIEPWSNSTWFIGRDKTIRACFERSSAFGLNDREARNAIDLAFQNWRLYLTNKTGPNNHTGTIDVPTLVEIADSCAKGADLTFYFGVQNAEVKNQLVHYNSPLAFAYRRAYKNYKWDSGFIWVRESGGAKEILGAGWNTSDLLVGILTHEIGHVLGNGHTSGTLMREGIVEFMRMAVNAESNARHVMMNSIDWDDDLLVSHYNFNYPGRVDVDYGDGRLIARWFKLLMGRDLVGKPNSRISRPYEDLVLEVSDDRGASSFTLDDFSKITTVSRQKTVFKIYLPEYPPYEQEFRPDVVVSTASIKTSSGNTMRATLQQGGGLQAAWVLQIYPDGKTPWAIFLKLPGGIPYGRP